MATLDDEYVQESYKVRFIDNRGSARVMGYWDRFPREDGANYFEHVLTFTDAMIKVKEENPDLPQYVRAGQGVFAILSVSVPEVHCARDCDRLFYKGFEFVRDSDLPILDLVWDVCKGVV